MKKFNLVLISLFTIVLSSVLMACSFKQCQAQFTQEQLVFNSSEQFDLKNFLKVENVDKSEIKFVVSPQTVFSLSGSMLSAKLGKSGKGRVYATYNGNNLHSMEIVVRKKFDAPKSVRWDERGYVTWDAVSGIFDKGVDEAEQKETVAEKFAVTGRRVVYDETGSVDESASKNLERTIVNGRRFDIPLDENGEMLSGEYHLFVQALQNEFFSDSDLSEEAVIYVGFMPQLKVKDFTFTDGTLSWSSVANAKFQVKIDEALVGEPQKSTSKDLTEYFELQTNGQHTVKVLVFDDSSSDAKKMVRESETLVITKLRAPTVKYSYDVQKGGQLEFACVDSPEFFEITLQPENGDAKVYVLQNSAQSSVKTALEAYDGFDELPAGLYSVKVVSKSNNSDGNFFFKSKETLLDKKIYKLPKANLSGMGGNLANGETFRARANAVSTQVATTFSISNVEGVFDGFDVAETAKTFNIPISRTGVFGLAITQLPEMDRNNLNGQEVYVINSDKGAEIDVAKLPQIASEISHEYKGEEKGQEKSTLIFNEIKIDSERQIIYRLKLKTDDGSFEYVSEDKIERTATGGGKITITLAGKIERLFQPLQNGEYVLAVEASTDDETRTIASLTERHFNVLSAPQKLDDGLLTDTYKWKSAAGEAPSEYHLEIFSLTKELFDQHKGDPQHFVPEESEGAEQLDDAFETAPSHHFDEGYYFVRIFAISGDENMILSSHECLSQAFLISKRLSIDDVTFGYDGGLGYYLQIETSDENVQGFNISIEGTSKDFDKSETNKYALMNVFDEPVENSGFNEAKSYKVSIKAFGKNSSGNKDEELYLVATDFLNVVKLDAITFDDLVFDAETKAFDIQYDEGTKKVEVELEHGTISAVEQEGSVHVDIKEKNDFTLKFTKIASDKYEIVSLGGEKYVYISSQESAIKFKRLNAPTNLAFENGDIKFSHAAEVSKTDWYVLDLALHGSAEYSMKITLKSETNIEVETESSSSMLTMKKSVLQKNANDVTIHIEEIFNSFGGQLKTMYDSATSVDFSAWAYRLNGEAETVELSSPLATINEQNTVLSVEKMKKVELHFVDGEKRSLTWSEVDAEQSVKAKTKYVLHQNSSLKEFDGKILTSQSDDSEFSGTSFSLEGADFEDNPSAYFTYFVEATNPQFLASSDSNYISIYKSPKISSSITASSVYFGVSETTSLGSPDAEKKGTLSFDIPDAEKSSGVEVKINGTKSEDENILQGKVVITEAGEYTFQILGKEEPVIAGDTTTYHLNGEISSWQVKDLSTQSQPGSVKFAGNIISWEYSLVDTEEALASLRFAIFFHQKQADKDTNYVYYTTAQETNDRQVDLMQNASLREQIGKFADTEVDVQVAAYIQPHLVSENISIYFSKATKLLNGESEWNYHILAEQAKITKLSAPKIEKVDFVGFDTKDEPEADEEAYVAEWQKRQNPTIKITFSGENYGTNAKFQAYFGQEETPMNVEFHSTEDGKYYFEVPKELYNSKANAGGVIVMKIYAISGGQEDSAGSLPSSAKTLRFERASNITGIKFLSDDYGKKDPADSKNVGIGYGRIVEISINPQTANQFVGPIVLKMIYTANTAEGKGATQQTRYKSVSVSVTDGKISFDDAANEWIENFINEKLVEGGEIQLFAYADFYADPETAKYVLPCINEIYSDKYVVLQHVTSGNISRVGEGFEINALPNNSENTIYVIKYVSGTQTKTVEAKADNNGRFVFKAPADWNVSNFDIFAVQADTNEQKFVRSKSETISFSLNRLDSVGKSSQIQLVRNESDQTLQLQWDKVENASGYLVRAFVNDDHAEFLCEVQKEALSDGKVYCSISDIFGKNYYVLKNKGYDLTKDFQIYLEITALGTEDYNNSLPKTVYATIQGNNLSVRNNDVFVNEKGLAYMKTEAGKKYMYRFITAANSEQLTKWTTVPDSGYLDTFGTAFEGMDEPRFEVEIFVMAEQTNSSDPFLFDSVVFTTQDDNDFTFEKLPEIVAVDYAQNSVTISLTFESNGKNERKVYVGVEKDAITKPDSTILVRLENDGTSNVFDVALNDVLLALDGEHIDYSSVSQIYFWAYEESTIETRYVLSQRFDGFNFGIEKDFSVKEILRLKDLDDFKDVNKEKDVNLYAQIWSNTYMTFDKTSAFGSRVLGINFKLTNRLTGFTFTYFVGESALSYDNNIMQNVEEKYRQAYQKAFEDKYVVNLNKVFDDEKTTSDSSKEVFLSKQFGIFDIAVMKVSTKTDGSYVVSEWISVWNDGTKERPLTFQRLEEMTDIQLSQGNLYWNSADDVVDEFYVYFYDYVEGQELSSYKVVLLDITRVAPQYRLDASAVAMDKLDYCLAIQSVDHNDYDDKFVIASPLTFKRDDSADGSGDITVVRKAQINSPLSLSESGSLDINWTDDGDPDNFITVLKLKQEHSGVYDYSDIANILATKVFKIPFTFTLKDLLDGKVSLKLRFGPKDEELGHSIVPAQTYVVNSFDILADLLEFCEEKEHPIDIQSLIIGLNKVKGEESLVTLMHKFSEAVTNKKSGVGTNSIFMDEYFESLQAGEYSLQYCLLGNYHTLSSEWYFFKNASGQNVIGINEAPDVNVVKIPSSSAQSNISSTYKVVFKKSHIKTADGNPLAERYYLKVGLASFEISKIGETTKYKLKLIRDYSRPEDELEEGLLDKSIEVYAANTDGSAYSGSGESQYLAFVINVDPTNSLMAVFESVIQKGVNDLKFEICAVGNSSSLSSKSILWKFTFLTFSNFSIKKGQFEWAVPGISTKIVVKKQGNSNPETEIKEGIYATSSFTLDEKYGAGAYDSIKFMLIGEFSTLQKNVVRIDSEILIVKNVYKLEEVSLSNNMGNIEILVGDTNHSVLTDSYTNSASKFVYEIRNDKSETSDIKNPTWEFMDEREDAECKNALNYVPGITGIVRDKDNDYYYDFKLTEQEASHYDVRVLGSTALLGKKDTRTYNEKEVYCIGPANELIEDKKIVTRSNWGNGMNAHMMESVSGFRIDDGIFVWEPVTGIKTDNIASDAKMVYRLEFEKYKDAVDGQSYSEKDKKVVYTTECSFDMGDIDDPEWQAYDAENKYKVTIRAMALKVSKTVEFTPYVELTDGQFAGGKARYQSGMFTLVSEGVSKDNITRLAPSDAESVKVEDRKLTWKFTTSDPTLTAENFKKNIDFVVMASSLSGTGRKYIDGEFSVELDYEVGSQKRFKIMFTEETGSLQGGKYNITVYTKLPQDIIKDVLRSYGVSGEIEKLEKFTENDYKIEINYANQRETLSLKDFFDKQENANKIVTAYIGEESFEFKAGQTKLYILRENESFEFDDAEYIKQVVIIPDSERKNLHFVVSAGEDVLSSDPSDTFVLERATWDESANISWDNTEAKFSWQPVEDIEEYVIEATYSYQTETGKHTLTRIYRSSETSFKPTIIGEVEFSLRIKYAGNNLQSAALKRIVGNGVQTRDDGVTKYVNFNLFSSGQGTETDPYVIKSSEEQQQFKNIAYRKVKENYLAQYLEVDGVSSLNKTEKQVCCFSIEDNIDLGTVGGILFAEEFGGEIFGNDNTISYIASTNATLKNRITIHENDNVAEIQSGVRTITYTRGASLFETLSSSAKIQHLKIDVKFATAETEISGPSIMAGVAITNSGTIQYVTLAGFASQFKSKNDNGVLAYAGLVGINNGTVENCSVESSIALNDANRKVFLFVSGIAYTNYSKITKCTSGKSGLSERQKIELLCKNQRTFVQVAGIAITKTTGATLSSCTNNFDISVASEQTNNGVQAYISGIVVLGIGMDEQTRQTNTNNGVLTTQSVNKVVRAADGIIATEHAS